MVYLRKTGFLVWNGQGGITSEKRCKIDDYRLVAIIRSCLEVHVAGTLTRGWGWGRGGGCRSLSSYNRLVIKDGRWTMRALRIQCLKKIEKIKIVAVRKVRKSGCDQINKRYFEGTGFIHGNIWMYYTVSNTYQAQELRTNFQLPKQKNLFIFQVHVFLQGHIENSKLPPNNSTSFANNSYIFWKQYMYLKKF